MTGLEKMLKVMEQMMNSVCDFLNLTMESILDFDGVLPTLDLTIWTREEDNKTMFLFYTKPMSSNTVLQRKSAMPENMKVASLNQEVIRRMLNTSEDLDDAMRMTVVDNFAKKVRNSGYCIKQTREIMMGGI